MKRTNETERVRRHKRALRFLGTPADGSPWAIGHAGKIIVAGALLSALVLVLGLFVMPGPWGSDRITLDAEKVTQLTPEQLVTYAKTLNDAENAVRDSALKIATGVAAIAAAFVAWGRIELSRREDLRASREHVSERFTKAIEQLGNDHQDIRLGGIYSLEGVARDSIEYRSVAFEVLAAFVREHAGALLNGAEGDTDPEPVRQPTDVQAALTVLGRHNRYTDPRTDHLFTFATPHRTDLRAAYLEGADLRGADFRGTLLRRVNLSNAQLGEADFFFADLTDADLTGADLSEANLPEANLTRANLTRANLSGANLSGAILTRANPHGMHLANLTSYLTQTDLSGADLRGGDLRGANLRGADLRGADLRDADLRDADLTEADLRNADLSGANLTDTIGTHPS
ncbi:MAG: pentapeptide repeat-containing protein [Acidimicrobiales bacterium]